jgi:hypothetical protein
MRRFPASIAHLLLPVLGCGVAPRRAAVRVGIVGVAAVHARGGFVPGRRPARRLPTEGAGAPSGSASLSSAGRTWYWGWSRRRDPDWRPRGC